MVTIYVLVVHAEAGAQIHGAYLSLEMARKTLSKYEHKQAEIVAVPLNKLPDYVWGPK